MRYSIYMETAFFIVFFACIHMMGGIGMALMKFCNRQGCSRLVPLGVKYCKVHTAVKAAEDKGRHKAYDKYRRNQEAQAHTLPFQSDKFSMPRGRNNCHIHSYHLKRQLFSA